MKKLICTAMFPLLLLLGCGSGGGSTGIPSKVSYSDTVGKGTVENYTNADWLYQNYLAEYGLPAEFKQSFMPALKMLANGFALQLNRNDPKQGDDVKASVEHFHKQFLQFVASGEAAQFVKSMSDSPRQSIIPDIASLTAAEQEEQMKNYVPPPMSDDAKQAVAAALAEDERVRAEVKKTADDYKLPYTIEGQDEQWFAYTPTMKGSGKGGGTAPATSKRHCIKSWNWREGDILWSNGQSGLGIPEHVGIVDTTSSKIPRAIEANTPEVVIFPDLDTWANRYTQIRGYTPNLNWNKSDVDYYNSNSGYFHPNFTYNWDSIRRVWAVTYANWAVGKPYGNLLNPRDTSKFYCSSLLPWQLNI